MCDFRSLSVPREEVTEARKQVKMVRTKADSVPGSYRKGMSIIKTVVMAIQCFVRVSSLHGFSS